MIIAQSEGPTNHDRINTSHSNGYKRQNILTNEEPSQFCSVPEDIPSSQNTFYSSNINSSRDLVEAFAQKDFVPLDLDSLTEYITSSL